MIQRGDIRWFRFSSPDKRQLPVIPISTQIRGLPWEVKLTPDDGLASVCVLKPEWMRSVERSFLGPWIASFPNHRWGEVRTALLDVLGLEL